VPEYGFDKTDNKWKVVDREGEEGFAPEAAPQNELIVALSAVARALFDVFLGGRKLENFAMIEGIFDTNEGKWVKIRLVHDIIPEVPGAEVGAKAAEYCGPDKANRQQFFDDSVVYQPDKEEDGSKLGAYLTPGPGQKRVVFIRHGLSVNNLASGGKYLQFLRERLGSGHMKVLNMNNEQFWVHRDSILASVGMTGGKAVARALFGEDQKEDKLCLFKPECGAARIGVIMVSPMRRTISTMFIVFGPALSLLLGCKTDHEIEVRANPYIHEQLKSMSDRALGPEFELDFVGRFINYTLKNVMKPIDVEDPTTKTQNIASNNALEVFPVQVCDGQDQLISQLAWDQKPENFKALMTTPVPANLANTVWASLWKSLQGLPEDWSQIENVKVSRAFGYAQTQESFKDLCRRTGIVEQQEFGAAEEA